MKTTQVLLVACVIAVLAMPRATAQAPRVAGRPLSVGAAVRDITPRPEWLPLYGVARSKLVGVIDPIHVRAIAVGNGGTPSLVVTFEMGGPPSPDTFLPNLSKHTGVPIEAIYYQGTHGHTAPSTDIDPNVPATALYNKFVYDQMVAAVDEAIRGCGPPRLASAIRRATST
jgi:hypothetical protein